MRIIMYLLDGVSGRKIPTLNNEEVNNHYGNVRTYIDDLLEKGHTLTNCYGFDNTQSSLYSVFTGQDIVESQVSQTRHAETFLDFNTTLAELLRSEGWKTNYFSNNYAINKGIIYKGFDQIFYKFEKYDLREVFENEEKISKSLMEDKSFIFFHDFYTHDQNGQYSRGKHSYTSEEYHDLIVEHSQILEKNLNLMNFNSSKDILILFSDHGMTVDSNIFKEAGSDPSMWSYNSKEFKAKVLVSVVGKGVIPQTDNRLFSLRNLFFTVKRVAGVSSGVEWSQDVLNPKALNSSLCFANFGNGSMIGVDRRKLHQFCCIKDGQKFIYQDNVGQLVQYSLDSDPFEENGKKLGAIEELPLELQHYYRAYKETRKKFSFKVTCAWLNSYVNFLSIRYYCVNPGKVFNYFKKRIFTLLRRKSESFNVK